MSIDIVQREDLEGGQRSGAGLSGDHASEARHRPRAHVVVVCAHRDEVFLREHDLGNGAAVNREGLEELWAGSHRLRMLNDHTHCA